MSATYLLSDGLLMHRIQQFLNGTHIASVCK
jgi:hypothetical protein